VHGIKPREVCIKQKEEVVGLVELAVQVVQRFKALSQRVKALLSVSL
jgi:hypothetical protein